jgi:hypothetical protein
MAPEKNMGTLLHAYALARQQRGALRTRLVMVRCELEGMLWLHGCGPGFKLVRVSVTMLSPIVAGARPLCRSDALTPPTMEPVWQPWHNPWESLTRRSGYTFATLWLHASVAPCMMCQPSSYLQRERSCFCFPRRTHMACMHAW